MAGPRTELVAIERETQTRRPGGAQDSAWASVGQLWVKADYIGGGEAEARGAVRETVRYRFTALSAGVEALGVTARDRVVWNGVAYNIREVPRRLPRRIETEIIGESGVAQ
jgi:head-tail adaptor